MLSQLAPTGGSSQGLLIDETTRGLHWGGGEEVRPLGALPTLKGPTQLTPGEVVTYEITNFDPSQNYAVSVDHGDVVLDGNMITLTVSGSPTLSITTDHVTRRISVPVVYPPVSGNYEQLAINTGQNDRRQVSGGVLDDTLYFGGGWTYSGSFKYFNDFYRYNPTDGTVTKLADMSSDHRTVCKMVGRDGLLYAFGGASENGNTSYTTRTLHCYNPQDNTWTLVHNGSGLPNSLTGGITIVDGVIYMVCNDTHLYRLNEIDNVWEVVATSDGTKYGIIDSSDRTIVLLSRANVGLFDLDSKSWTYKPNETDLATYLNMEVANGVVYLYSGRASSNAFITSFWVLDLESLVWVQLPSGGNAATQPVVSYRQGALYSYGGDAVFFKIT